MVLNTPLDPFLNVIVIGADVQRIGAGVVGAKDRHQRPRTGGAAPGRCLLVVSGGRGGADPVDVCAGPAAPLPFASSSSLSLEATAGASRGKAREPPPSPSTAPPGRREADRGGSPHPMPSRVVPPATPTAICARC
uniref:Uncharacterized protein n=1 Tax=Oryza sativa subsp. japonica TaxID=39947 RepID=Q5ZAI8_ORYSJ|nr:hypothetical protein [Oryza sativa Japonica Group]